MTGLVFAVAAACCYGVGSVLQAAAARRTDATAALDPRLLLRLSGSWRYLLGLVLDVIGFVLALGAVRSAPLFLVQAVLAGFLAVAAVLGAIVFRTPLTRADRVALLVVTAGLALLGLSAAPDTTVVVHPTLPWMVLGATVMLVPLAVVLGRRPARAGAVALGAVAGLAFGATSVAARIATTGAGSGSGLGRAASIAGHLALQPATWAVVLAGVLAQLAYATALQRGSVAEATAPLVVAETVVPALVGLALLGDRPRAGWTAAAVLGFCLAVGGAVRLSGHAEPADPGAGPPLDRTG